MYDDVIYCPSKAKTEDSVSLCPSLCLPSRLSVNLSVRLSAGPCLQHIIFRIPYFTSIVGHFNDSDIPTGVR